jgi:nucleoid DNA-binding protein
MSSDRLTKTELQNYLAQIFRKVKSTSVKNIVEMAFEYIKAKLTEGTKIEFKGFGTFEVVVRKSRIGTNFKTGQRVVLPPRKVVVFKAAKSWLKQLNKKPQEQGQ